MAAALAVAGLAAAFLNGLWKRPPMLLVMLFLAWAGSCSLLRGTLWNDLYAYVPAACAMLFCFAAGLADSLDALRRTMRTVCAMWACWMTILSAAALYAAFSGTHLHQTAWNRFIGINAGDDRLYIMDFCTNAAGNLLSAALAAFICVLTEKRRPVRLLYAAAMAVLLCALSLTDARTSFIGLGVGIGAVLACLVYHHVEGGKGRRYAAAFGCAAVTLVLCYLLMGCLTNLLGGLVPGRVTALLPTALADEGTVTHRAIGSGNSLLTYR